MNTLCKLFGHKLVIVGDAWDKELMQTRFYFVKCARCDFQTRLGPDEAVLRVRLGEWKKYVVKVQAELEELRRRKLNGD